MKTKILLIVNLLFVSINLFATTHYEINTSSIVANQNYENYSQAGYGGVFLVNYPGVLTLNNVIFSANRSTLKDSSYNGRGGAIYTDTMINISSSEFNNNYAIGNGGAIYNNNSTNNYLIKISSTKFNGNEAKGTTADSFYNYGYGGAIYNNGNSLASIEINSTFFISNMAKASKLTVSGSHYTTSDYGYGGAIYNRNGTINIKDTTFENNVAYDSGGAIYNELGTISIEDGTIFNNNVAKVEGGAIYNLGTKTAIGTINLTANKGNIEFTGNTANGISNAIYSNGILNLCASKNAEIIFNDRITSAQEYLSNYKSIVLNINRLEDSYSLQSSPGKIVLNEDMSGYCGDVNMYGGELELKAKGTVVNTNKFFSGKIYIERGILNILNNAIDNIIVQQWNSSALNSNLKIDLDLSNNAGDNFTVRGSASGELNLIAINLLGADGDSGQITLFNNGKSPALKILTTSNYGGYEYSFTKSDIPGVLNYTRTGLVAKTFKEVINTTEPTIRSYSLIKNETVVENLGYLGGTQLTIFGNGYNIDGNSNSGVTISEGQTLNIENVKEIKNFSSNNFDDSTIRLNGGMTNIGNDVTFSSNTSNKSGVIYSSYGYINIGDNVIFNSNTVGAGSHSGMIDNVGGTLTFGNDTIFSLNVSHDGGAIENMNDGKIIIKDRAQFISNKATGMGGAMYIASGIVEIGNNVMFSSNIANTNGGAIHNSGILTIQDGAKFIGNTAKNRGGAIDNTGGTITIGANAIFNGNKVEANDGNAYGGAIYNDGGTITIGANAIFNGNKVETNNGSAYGGAIYNEGGTITITDGARFESNILYSSMINNDCGTINIIAKTNDVFFCDNGQIGAVSSKGGIINLWASETAKIESNCYIEGDMNSTILNINKQIEGYQESVGTGTIEMKASLFSNKINFYGGTIKICKMPDRDCEASFYANYLEVFNSPTIDMANDIVEKHNFNNLTVNNKLNLVVDADLESKKMDEISATSFSGAGKITVNKIKIIKDNKINEKTKLPFADNVLKDEVEFTGKVESLLYKYNASYDATTGVFTFVNAGDSDDDEINMETTASAVAASVGGYAIQTVIVEQAFAGIGSKISNNNKNSANINASNLYVSAGNQIFDDSTTIERSLWLRPFALQETIKLNGVDIDNTLYGTLAGIDLPVGQDKQLSFYLGYTGSKQEFDEIKTNQTGYVIGVTGMLVKEKWYLGATVNGIFNKVSADSEDETNDFDMNMFTVGAKAGYNINLSDKWILEPNITVMYGIANSDAYETSLGSIDSQSTSNILVEPQVKAKWQLTNGWQPYGLVGYSANLSGKPKVKAGGEELELDSIDGFVEYGIGVNKEFIGSVWSCYGQVTGRSGGRNGFSGNLGIKYRF